MAMTKIQKKALDFTKDEFSDELNVKPAIIHLKKEGIFTDNDEQEINSKTTEQEKVSEFIELLKKRGSRAFEIFHRYLKGCTGSSHLAEELTENLQIATQKVTKTQKPFSTDATENDEWPSLESKFYSIRCDHQTVEEYTNIPNNVNILLIGKTGSGKSSTGNTLLGSPEFKEQNTSRSETKTITMKKVTEGNKVITVIDTPGLFDTEADFTNKELMLEIVKTAIDLRQGIHLFLLVCGPNIKYTEEEEKSVTIVESILTKDVYKKCVLVLSSAYSQFGMKDASVESYIAGERAAGGKFSNLIERMNGRVIAVENCFKKENLKRQHRQRFLCALMQVITDNDGRCYSNNLFKIVNQKIERDEKERRSRIERERELAKMRNDLETFLLEKYLLSLPAHDLLEDRILAVFKDNVDDIMCRSMIKQLSHVTKKDVKGFLKQFVFNKREMIENILALKQQEENQEQEIRRKSMEIRQKEDQFKMHSLVLSNVTTYLRDLRSSQLQNIQKNKCLPQDKIEEIMTKLEQVGIHIEQKQVKHFIKETFFSTGDEIERIISERLLEENLTKQADRLRRFELDFSNQKLGEKLRKEVPDLIDSSEEDDLKTLKSCLQERNLKHSKDLILKLAEKVSKNPPNDSQRDESSLISFIESYFLENGQFIEKAVENSLKLRETKRKLKDQRQKEKKRLKALTQISDTLNAELCDFLRGKNYKQLKALEDQIESNTVPSEILTTVTNKLKEEDLNVLDEATLKKEILWHIRLQSDTIEDIKKEAGKCFAGCNLVITKRKRLINISEVVVGDEVLAVDSHGTLFYDNVYLLSHANKIEELVYIEISTTCGNVLFISPNHLLPINGLHNYVPAKMVNVGDTLFSVNNNLIIQNVVTSVSYQKCKGAFCPMTMNGTIVVSGVVASCFTTFINPSLAHFLLLPFRVMFNCLPTSVFQIVFPYEGKEGMPVILAKCRSAVMLTTFFADYCKGKLAVILKRSFFQNM